MLNRYLAYDHGGRTACVVIPCKPLDDALSAIVKEQDIKVQHYWNCPKVAPLLALHVGCGGVTPSLHILPPNVDDDPSASARFSHEHAQCLKSGRVIVVKISGTQELMLTPVVGLTDSGGRLPVYWGYVLPPDLSTMVARQLELSRLALILDLDETLIVATPVGKLCEKAVRAKQASDAAALDLAKLAEDATPEERQRMTLLARAAEREEELLSKDAAMLRYYSEHTCVMVGGRRVSPTYETSQDANKTVTRPVVRLDSGALILTRIIPDDKHTSVLVRVRPGWEKLRACLAGEAVDCGAETARIHQRFDVFVCTAAQRPYALEMWRLLDPHAQIIPEDLRPARVTNILSAAGEKKSLIKALGLAGAMALGDASEACTLPLAVVVDDRTDVWDASSQSNVLQVLPFNYYRDEALRLAGGEGGQADVSEKELLRVQSAVLQLRRDVYKNINLRCRVVLDALTKSGAPIACMASANSQLVTPVVGVGLQLKDPKWAGLYTVPSTEAARLLETDSMGSTTRPAVVAASSAQVQVSGVPAATAAAAAKDAAADPLLKPVDPRKRKLDAQPHAAEAAMTGAAQRQGVLGSAGGRAAGAATPDERCSISGTTPWTFNDVKIEQVGQQVDQRAAPLVDLAVLPLSHDKVAGMSSGPRSDLRTGGSLMAPQPQQQQQQTQQEQQRQHAQCNCPVLKCEPPLPLLPQRAPAAPPVAALGQQQALLGGSLLPPLPSVPLPPQWLLQALGEDGIGQAMQLLNAIVTKRPHLQPTLQQYLQKNGAAGLMELLEKLSSQEGLAGGRGSAPSPPLPSKPAGYGGSGVNNCGGVHHHPQQQQPQQQQRQQQQHQGGHMPFRGLPPPPPPPRWGPVGGGHGMRAGVWGGGRSGVHQPYGRPIGSGGGQRG